MSDPTYEFYWEDFTTGFVRDRAQRTQLHEAQRKERAPYHQKIEALQEAQKAHRSALAQRIATVLRVTRTQEHTRQDRGRDHELELGF